MAKMSIIVPVYNVERYLDRCLQSLLKQTLADIELILVDDGSTDTSPKICDSYAKLDSRIIVLHQINGGLSDARNKGVSIATSKYISFVDADDYIDLQMAEFLYDKIIETKADVVTSLVKEYQGEVRQDKEVIKQELIVSGKEAFKKLLESDNIEMYAVAKLVKRELLLDNPFPVGKTYEDAYTMPKLLYQCALVCITTEKFYNYIRRDNSITLMKFSNSDFNCIEAHQKNLEFVINTYPQCIKGAQFRYWWANLYVLDRMTLLGNNDPRSDEIMKMLKGNKKLILENPFLSKKRKLVFRVLCISPMMYKMIIKKII